MLDVGLFFCIAGAGMLLTLLLCITSKKEKENPTDVFERGFISLFGLPLSISVLLYLFRLSMMAVAGVVSQAYEQVILGIPFALIPILGYVILRIKKINTYRRG